VSRPRVLFLSQVLPYPPSGGVQIRTYHTLRILASAYDVTAVCFYRGRIQDAKSVRNAVEALSQWARVEAHRLPSESGWPRLLADHLRSVLRRRPYTYYIYRSTAVRRRMMELLRRERFDLVHVDSLDLLAYLPLFRDLPVVCAHHNVESRLLQRRAWAEKSWWRRRYLTLQARLLERGEREWCGRVTLNIGVSEADIRTLRSIAAGGTYAVVPNGVDTDAFRPASDDATGGLVFVGGCSWFPNRDALSYFCAEILPLLREKVPGVAVRWVGRASDELRREMQERHGIEMPGFVSDIRPYVQAASCYVVPLRIGGGTRLKILDAWAMGKAVVSTSVGCEGLDARHGENLLVADTPAAFADAVDRVLRDVELRRALGRAARETAERTYGWDVIGSGMLQLYRRILDARAAGAAPSNTSGAGAR
jgi:glycosyltransferase involved in cell wall biosynthesis